SAVCVLPTAAHESAVPHNHLPPVNITAPEATPPKRAAKPKRSQTRGMRTTRATRPDQPAAGAGGVAPGAAPDGAAALQPTAASAIRFTGAEVNAVPFSRPGEALEIVPGLIVTHHSVEGKGTQYVLRGCNLHHDTHLPV